MEDACSKWTPNDKLQQWFNDAKKDSISTGLVIERVERNRNGELLSELDSRSDQVTCRIINMHLTHHNFSIAGDKVGLGRLCLIILIIRGCKRNVKAGRHVTGVYATNAPM